MSSSGTSNYITYVDYSSSAASGHQESSADPDAMSTIIKNFTVIFDTNTPVKEQVTLTESKAAKYPGATSSKNNA